MRLLSSLGGCGGNDSIDKYVNKTKKKKQICLTYLGVPMNESTARGIFSGGSAFQIGCITHTHTYTHGSTELYLSHRLPLFDMIEQICVFFLFKSIYIEI